jgi:hypothetical protein
LEDEIQALREEIQALRSGTASRETEQEIAIEAPTEGSAPAMSVEELA